jgi:hypothetical protein
MSLIILKSEQTDMRERLFEGVPSFYSYNKRIVLDFLHVVAHHL